MSCCTLKKTETELKDKKKTSGFHLVSIAIANTLFQNHCHYIAKQIKSSAKAKEIYDQTLNNLLVCKFLMP